jgi:hypothetical protein
MGGRFPEYYFIVTHYLVFCASAAINIIFSIAHLPFATPAAVAVAPGRLSHCAAAQSNTFFTNSIITLPKSLKDNIYLFAKNKMLLFNNNKQQYSKSI